MTTKPRFMTVLAVSMVLALAGCRATPLQNVVDASYGSTASARALSLEDYRKAILRAGAKRKWVFTDAGPGHLIGNVNVRGKHEATVDVYFDTEQFSIRHQSSRNLNYDAANQTIHPNFNTWLRNLESDIRAEIQILRAT
ncbi:MAG: hypothetical protein AAF415_03155 [Pseudomonadota bacterium]